jgi:Holliday junction DNA helicase RuvA
VIGYLRGQILENNEGKLIVVAGGVGYAVSVPENAASIALKPGVEAEFFIHTHVREDALDLYGFVSRGEKALFLTLLSVNGIGPKGALGILSKVEPAMLVEAILSDDKSTLNKIPGVGKKTAERLVVELADSLRKKVDAGDFGRAKPKAPAGATFRDPVYEDARVALLGLGYREADVVTLLNRVKETGDTPARAEDLIRTALQRMS